MNTAIIAPIAALVIGGAAGFLAGQKSAPEPSSEAPTGDARGARRSAAGNTSSDRSADRTAGVRVKSAKEAMEIPGQNNRLQALMDYYAGLDPSQFEEEAKKYNISRVVDAIENKYYELVENAQNNGQH